MGAFREIGIHSLLRIVFRQAFFHFGPLHRLCGIAFEHALLHQEAAKAAERAHVQVHGPGLKARVNQMPLVLPYPRRNEMADQVGHDVPPGLPPSVTPGLTGGLGPLGKCPQRIPVQRHRTGRVPPDIPEICNILINHMYRGTPLLSYRGPKGRVYLIWASAQTPPWPFPACTHPLPRTSMESPRPTPRFLPFP